MPLDRAVQQTPEGNLDLVHLLLWARRTHVVDPRDLAMLVDYFTARGGGIVAGHDHVARLHGVTPRTSRRRCATALQALRAAGLPTWRRERRTDTAGKFVLALVSSFRPRGGLT